MLDQTLSVLADPTRRRIVERLAVGSATVTEIVEDFELTQPTISSHLKLLEEAGLISRVASRTGRDRVFLEPEGLQSLGLWIGELRTIYEQNYARLDAVLDKMKSDIRGEEQP